MAGLCSLELAPRSARLWPCPSLTDHDKATRWDSRIASGAFSFSSFQAPTGMAPSTGLTASDRRAGRKTVAISREACSSRHVSRFTARARLCAGPGLLFPLIHPDATVRQNPRQDHVQPLHVSPPFASSKSRKEEPRCRSNPPSLENLAKVQMR